MKVRLKKEIVTLGAGDIPVPATTGTHVDPAQWNELINDPDAIVIDTRNTYETAVGTFENAIDPKTTNFREFPDFVSSNLADKKDKKIVMFCTGGIRCEKASAYMKQQGFDEVYQLKGGILNYLETVNPEISKWEGDCFVFDDRVTVNHSLDVGAYDMCHGCRHPITLDDKQSDKYERGVSCPKCFDSLSEEKKAQSRQRQFQIDLAKKRGEHHLGTQGQH